MKLPSTSHRLRIPAFVSSLLLAVTPFACVNAQHSLYGIGSGYGEIFRIDPSQDQILDRVLLPFVNSAPNEEFFGATANPADGLIYVIVNDRDDRPILATLDPSDGSFSALAVIGTVQDPGNSSSLAFGPSDTLYLITGGGGNNSPNGAIYTIDTTTGEATPTGWTTAGVGAHAIEYNPSDPGFLYHFFNSSDSGGGTPGLEKISLTTGIATPVPLSGAPGDLYGRANAVAFLNGAFYVLDRVDEKLHSVTPAGAVTLLGSTSSDPYNLSAVGSKLYAVDSRNSGELVEINSVNGSDVSTTALGAIPNYRIFQFIARDPTTGILHGLGTADFPAPAARTLFQIDPLSGSVAEGATISEDLLLSSGTFDASGNLYAVITSTGGPVGPVGLRDDEFVTVDITDGTVTPTNWATRTNGNSIGYNMAYNPDDGLIYYVFTGGTGLEFRTVDPSNGTITDLGVISGGGGSIYSAMAYDPDQNVFWLSRSKSLYRLTTGGVLTLESTIDRSESRSAVIEFIPDLKITGFTRSGSDATVSFESVLNREYGLYSSPDLSADSFTLIPGFERISATPPVNTATNVPLPAPDKGFFRLGAPGDL